MLLLLHNPRLGPKESWALVTEIPAGPHIPEPALALVGSGGGVRIGVTQPNTRGEALAVLSGVLVVDLPCGALP